MFEKLDKTDWKVLNLIVDNPYKKFYLREISKELNISPSSVKKALDRLKELNLTKEEHLANLRIISANIEETLLKQIKKTKNIEMINPLIKIEPSTSIVLFGSMAKGENDNNSDIDLLVITNKHEPFDLHEYKNHPVQIIKMSPANWKKVKENNPALTKEIKQGILLKGEMPE